MFVSQGSRWISQFPNPQLTRWNADRLERLHSGCFGCLVRWEQQNLGRTVFEAQVFGSCGAGGAFGSPDVATRDFGKPQTLNNGASISMPAALIHCSTGFHTLVQPSARHRNLATQVVLIRSSQRGHFFLDLLLEKVGLPGGA